MFSFVVRLLLLRYVIAVLSLAAAIEGYRLLGPTNDSLGFMRRSLAERICNRAARDLPARENVRTTGVLDLAGDITGYLTRTLKQEITDAGKYELLEESFLRKLLREFGRDDAPVVRLDDAVAAARRLGVDAIVFGEVREYTTTDRGATLRLELRMAERDSGQAVFARSYREQIEGRSTAPSYWRARMADSSKGRRTFIWVVFALLLPIVSAPLIRRLTAEESNAINLLVLIGYTVVDMLAALLLTGFWIPTVWTWLLLFGALGASGYYNYRIATAIDELRR